MAHCIAFELFIPNGLGVHLNIQRRTKPHTVSIVCTMKNIVGEKSMLILKFKRSLSQLTKPLKFLHNKEVPMNFQVSIIDH